MTNASANTGAYVLLIALDSAVEVALRGNSHTLAPGLYAYCGSARGPGGLRARIERHRRKDKKIHWHVDQVTVRASIIEAGASTQHGECDLVDLLMENSGVSAPVPGFGASDCSRCETHFLRLVDEEPFHSLDLRPFGP